MKMRFPMPAMYGKPLVYSSYRRPLTSGKDCLFYVNIIEKNAISCYPDKYKKAVKRIPFDKQKQKGKAAESL